MSRIVALALTASLFAAVSSPAHAGTVDLDDDGPRSANTALGLSLGTTLAGAGTMLIAAREGHDQLATLGAAVTALGPSAGHWYSGHYFTRGMGVRTAGAAVAFAGFAVALDACPILGDHCDSSPLGVGLLVVGSAAYVAGSVDDIVTAPAAARRYNREHSGVVDVAIAPVVTPHQAGLSVSGRF